MAEKTALQRKWELVKDWCERNGMEIKQVGHDVLHDYAAMNPEAAKGIGFKACKDGELLHDSEPGFERRVKNMGHEIHEYRQMKGNGHVYWPAHLAALDFENASVETWEKELK